MSLIPIKLPAGFYRNGTEYEAKNRWYEGSLVRWLDNSLRPIGGWTVRKSRFSENPVQGMHTWQDNAGTAWVAGGSHDKITVMTGAGVTYDITPDDLAAGRSDAAVNTGYGFGYYGTGYYGQPGRLLQRQYLKKVRFGCLIILGNYWLPCTRMTSVLLFGI